MPDIRSGPTAEHARRTPVASQSLYCLRCQTQASAVQIHAHLGQRRQIAGFLDHFATCRPRQALFCWPRPPTLLPRPHPHHFEHLRMACCEQGDQEPAAAVAKAERRSSFINQPEHGRRDAAREQRRTLLLLLREEAQRWATEGGHLILHPAIELEHDAPGRLKRDRGWAVSVHVGISLCAAPCLRGSSVETKRQQTKENLLATKSRPCAALS